eukprot:8944808-Pyramimonas_sp.AAC.1
MLRCATAGSPRVGGLRIWLSCDKRGAVVNVYGSQGGMRQANNWLRSFVSEGCETICLNQLHPVGFIQLDFPSTDFNNPYGVTLSV